MARPHHRKKHKEHLKQFQHRADVKEATVKGKGSTTFAVVGAVVGLAILYFATQGNIIWTIAGALAGGVGGYFIGNNIDKTGKK